MHSKEKQQLLHLWQSNPKGATAVTHKRFPQLIQFIVMSTGDTFSEKVWRWIHDSPKNSCALCGKPTKYLDFRRGYTHFCSTKCSTSSTSEKKESTLIERYGVSHYSKTEEYKQKFKQTCRARYGVDNPGQIDKLLGSRSRKKQLTFYLKLLEDIQNFTKPNFLFDEYTHVRDTQLSWTCVHCSNEFRSNIFGKSPMCPTCYPSDNIGGQSQIEKDVLSEIRKFYHGEIIENSRNIISPKEIDIYFPEFRFAIEINGIYWHSSQRQFDNNYHSKKFELCDKLKIKLMMITDYEWYSNKELLIRMIKHRMNISEIKVAARKCLISQISPAIARSFLVKNHIHGFSNATEHLGLFINNELITVLSYMSINRFNKNVDEIEIIRLAFSVSVVGALGKFIKYIKTKFPQTAITSYADLRFGTGEVYIQNNFVLSHCTKPGYWYFVNGKLYHRLSWTKKKLIKMGYDPSKTEMQIMEELGALRIYDCGHRCYKLI